MLSVPAGGHLNPAVTLAFLITKKLSVPRALLYMLAQLGGAILGSFLVKYVCPARSACGSLLAGAAATRDQLPAEDLMSSRRTPSCSPAHRGLPCTPPRPGYPPV